MSVVKHFIDDSIKKAEIDEFLQSEFERAGYGGVNITKTPLGTHIVVYTMRPGLVIGRGGETIRALATVLEEKFDLPSPQISVAEIEIPELNAFVVASRIASALKRGVHYRRAGFWGLTQAMQAGALGIEIVIKGKLRTDRARYEKFREGYLPKSGEPPRKWLRKAVLHVNLKPGTLGVQVSLIPPDAVFPDQIKVHIIEEESKPEPEKEIVDEQAVTEEKLAEPVVSPVEETTETKKAEPGSMPPSVPEKKKETKKPVKTKATPAKVKVVTEEKAIPVVDNPENAEKIVEKVVAPVEKKVVTKKKVAKAKVPVDESKVVAKKKQVKIEAKPVVAKVAKPVVAKVAKPVATKKEQKAVEKPVSPVKEKVVPKKKVAKTKASAKVEKKKAGE